MSFITDKQTLEDLGLLGKFKQHSVFSIFNKVKTGGGERLLTEMFHQPLTDATAINERSSLFHYFQNANLSFPFDTADFNRVENYMSSVINGNGVTNLAAVARKKFAGAFLHDKQYEQLQQNLRATIAALVALRALVNKLDIPMTAQARQFLSGKKMQWLDTVNGQTLSILNTARYDSLLRNTLRKEMEWLLETIYQLDVYIAVSSVSRERGFYYATALPGSANVFGSTALRHPGLPNAVPNAIRLDSSTNLLFLTGANMAGKSTLMKSFGIALYMGHMGFPVAAANMRFSIRDGLYTSINVPDNLNMGYSHFYAEVLRVKKVAQEVSNRKNMVVIFDELFKGTNVKDAYDATLACTVAFSRYRNSAFIISTHIIEVGEALKPYNNIQFGYMPTVMKGNQPTYPYTLTSGITSDRQGMLIIENEKILEALYN
ncbi:MutS-related protein [Pseudobacter ginsenosidimutans]|uniref:MutS-like protein n=1 Tax=Pseudobacter ginsenosidimutans TaxID=661488 RepID=A0A4Q7MYB1_9BACT|nr:DNA mismatch repair protein [Pseudobacter ginsenosidimutans]QEC42847.1 DNA mismatch repair protein [Pseudobacter ginsenosidimutans]RZS74197.1 MutS-like protein [Pseudobacter ginsenosidimutans]